jgi:uncharacterized membrane protein
MAIPARGCVPLSIQPYEVPMKSNIQAALAAAIVSLAFATPAAAGEAPATTLTQKAVDCAHDKDAKARKPECDVRSAAHEPQTHKMTRCNQEAGKKQLHGEERRAFMSACLKG